MATEVNPSIAAATPCDFPWWSDTCSALIADLDAKGGERFVASHDDEGFDTRNWLHVRRTPTQESTAHVPGRSKLATPPMTPDLQCPVSSLAP